MNSADIIAYGFEAATYHVECIDRTVRKAMNSACTCGSRDENGLCDSNCNGYGPNPVFASEEEPGTCDVCLLPIDT
jgi:hypothetical protein